MSMANFAKAQLMKYGWTEGKGLGKHENGITEALKPRLKFDTVGIGSKDTDSNQWWEAAFDKAASNIIVDAQTNGITFSSIKKDAENAKAKKLKGALKYGSFLKTSVLSDGNLIQENNFEDEEVENVSAFTPLTDEELFKACGGRTAHKGARHGLTLNGKLERIAEQEKKLLGRTVSEGTSGSSGPLKEKSKKNKLQGEHRESQEDDYEVDSNANTILPPLLPTADDSSKQLSKKTRRKQKRRINNLTHQLDVLCNMNDEHNETEPQAPDGGTSKKKKQLKRKRDRDRKESTNSDSARNAAEEDVDNEICNIPLPPASEVEGKKKAKKKKSHKVLDNKKSEDQSDQHLSHNNEEESNEVPADTKKKKKSKRRRSQSRQGKDIVSAEANQEGPQASKKSRRSHRKKDVDSESLTRDEDVGSKLKPDSVCDARPISDEIQDTTSLPEKYNSESADAYTKQEADRLNARIKKKKSSRSNRRQRFKLESITESLRAVHFNVDESPKVVNAKQKMETIVQDLLAVNITENVTKKMKKAARKNKK